MDAFRALHPNKYLLRESLSSEKVYIYELISSERVIVKIGLADFVKFGFSCRLNLDL